MFATSETPAPRLLPAQALELCLLVDLEAQWENLRKPRPQTLEGRSMTAQDLHNVQKAYEAFRVRLGAFNKKYTPAHATDLVLNYPDRLGHWCRRMRDLYLQVEHHLGVPSPVHLLEKAYRCADGMAGRVGKEPFRRSGPLDSIRAAIRELEALAQWCDGETRIAN